jgi:hypothetical protein
MGRHEGFRLLPVDTNHSAVQKRHVLLDLRRRPVPRQALDMRVQYGGYGLGGRDVEPSVPLPWNMPFICPQNVDRMRPCNILCAILCSYGIGSIPL